MKSDALSPHMDAGAVRGLLTEIGNELAVRHLRYEIAIYGGGAMLLQFDARHSTRDIDFTCVSTETTGLMQAASRVGRRNGMRDGWFNDAVAMFASPLAETAPYGDYPAHGEGGLRVLVATPRYLLAMKLLSMRSTAESHDLHDIWRLIDVCGLKSVQEAESWVSRFYPDDQMTERQMAILEDVFDAKAAGKQFDPLIGW